MLRFIMSILWICIALFAIAVLGGIFLILVEPLNNV